MKVSLEYLEQCAGETGYQVGTLEKVTRLGEIAAEIARHPLLGRALALKGGTALNLCIGDAPTRMSVDLDYNYIAHVDREQMLAERPRVEAAVEEIARRLDYRVQRSADAFANRKLHATYRSVLGGEARVEVDLNFLFRRPLDDLVDADLWQPGELDRPRIRMVSLLELCVGKLLALLERAAPRDAWDTVRLPTVAGGVFQSPRFRTLFIGMAAILDHPISTYTRVRMEQLLTVRMINSQLAPMLTAAEPPDATTLIDRAWRVVAPFVDLNQTEAQYIAGIERAELQPELLAPGQPELVGVLADHPAIRWKIRNVERHRGTGPD